MPGLIDTDLGLCDIDNGLIWLEGGLGGAGLSPEPLPPGTMITEDGIIMITEVTLATMITETDLTPSWVLSVGGFGADLDIDFVGDQAWDGADAAISDLLTCVRASPALTYAQTSAGALTSFAANTLRYTDLGLLVEESRTNIGLQSQTIGSATWTKSNASVSADSTVAPDGTSTADSLIEDTSSGIHRMRQDITISNATDYTVSVYVKAIGARYFFFNCQNGINARAVFDLSGSGSVTLSSGGTAAIVAVGNGFYRCSVQNTSNSTSGIAFMQINSASNTFDDVYTGDGASGLIFWGFQWEAGSFPTSYIPTTSTSVTRSADVVTYSASLSIFTPADGTVYVQQGIMQSIGGGATGGFTSSADHTFGVVRNGGAGTNWYTIDQNAAFVVNSGVSPTVATKLAASYGGAGGRSQAISVNGNAAVTGTAPHDVAQVTNFYFGSNAGVAQNDNYIQRFAYWDVQLSNSNLVTLTS